MRTLVAFLLGLIIGAVAILFLPDPRRDELNTEVRKQTDALQTQLHQFGDQLETLSLPKPEKPSASPCATGTQCVRTICANRNSIRSEWSRGHA